MPEETPKIEDSHDIESEVRITEHKDGSVTIHHPKGRRSQAAIAALMQSDDVLREKVGGFANFVRDYGVVAVAVGFIVAQQASGVIKQLVTSFIDPLTEIWFGVNLSTQTATLHHNASPVLVPWGAFVLTLLEFFIVLVFVYFVIKLFRLDKLKKIDEKPKK